MADLVKQVSEADFQQEVLESALPVLVDFWAPWCGPCKRLAPVVDALAEEYAGKLKVCKINVDDNPNLAAKFQVMSIPTLVAFKGGQAEGRVIGAMVPEIHALIGKVI